jgi:hypothetical protein
MLVSLAGIPGSPFLPYICMPLEILMAHIVTCGLPMFSVFPTTSIILLFLTSVRTIFGLFHFTLNLIPFRLCQNFLYEKTQFGCTIKSILCDNRCELDNSTSYTIVQIHGVTMRISFPHTSPQNG